MRNDVTFVSRWMSSSQVEPHLLCSQLLLLWSLPLHLHQILAQLLGRPQLLWHRTILLQLLLNPVILLFLQHINSLVR